MAFSDQERADIIAMINLKGPKLGDCPACATQKWGVMPAPFFVPLQEVRRTGEMAPLVGVLCGNCGYTILFNMLVLGLNDLVNKHKGP